MVGIHSFNLQKDLLKELTIDTVATSADSPRCKGSRASNVFLLSNSTGRAEKTSDARYTRPSGPEDGTLRLHARCPLRIPISVHHKSKARMSGAE